MVLLHVKKDDQSLFLFSTTVEIPVHELLNDVIALHNGCLKIERLCFELGMLIDHGPFVPPEMHGLNDEQIEELKLVDDWANKHGFPLGKMDDKDPCAKRSGIPPKEKMKEVLVKAIAEAKGIISKEQVSSGVSLSQQHIQDALDIIRGSVMIAYPMQLPYYDPIACELENSEDLTGTCYEKRVLEPSMTQIWFAGKELQCDKKLKDYVGKNEKSKVIVKIQKRGFGAPSREPPINDEERKALMLSEFKRREQLKKLEEDEDDRYLNSNWADPAQLKRSFHGLQDISWKPR